MATLKKQRTLSILNMLAVLFTIGINYYSQLYTINGNRVSDMSNKYSNLFTPAGYAFAITDGRSIKRAMPMMIPAEMNNTHSAATQS